MTSRMQVNIRFLISRDMYEVAAIERECFERPWGQRDFKTTLSRRNVVGMVAEAPDVVAGFMIYELHRSMLRVLNFAVDPKYHRRGIGSAMVDKLVAKLLLQRRHEIITEVRESNLSAQLFFKNCGFQALTILRGYYDDTGEDAYVMRYALAGHEAAFQFTDTYASRFTESDFVRQQ